MILTKDKLDLKIKIGWALMRVSTKSQAEVQHGSLEQQRHMLERWSLQQCDNTGSQYKITKFFEEDVSGRGKAIHKRMALMEIERAIESRSIDFVVFEKIDRLARDMIYNLGLVKKAQEYGVEVHEFESGKIDLRDRGNRLGFNIKNLLAEEYSLDLEEKITKKQREARFNNGKDTSTRPVLGINPHPAKRGMYVINEKEQKVVIEIFKKFIESGSLKETASFCKIKNYRNKVRMTKEKVDKNGNIYPPREVGGDELTPKLLRALMTNPKIKGYSFFKDTWNQFKNQQDENGMIRWDYPHGAVVPAELFDQAQRVLELNQKFDARTRTSVYLLTGILEFEDGTQFSGAGAGGRNNHYEYYHCRKHKLRVPKDKIEVLVVKRIKEYMKDSELLKKLISEAKPMTDLAIPILKTDISEIKQQISKNRKVIDGFTSYIRQAALTDPTSIELVIRTVTLERDKAETETQLLERELINKQNQLDELMSQNQGESLKDYLTQVLQNFDMLEETKKREVIHTIIPRIEVVQKNKLRLHIRTDIREKNSRLSGSAARGGAGAYSANENASFDSGQGVASYSAPLSLEQNKNLNLKGVTPGGNFSSREEMAE